ncbi:thermonuclease family protein [Conchiformibius steedae]|uniref:thermonuclease family protein n=1 Tax=Conchiformibius steedae TaxID=153493 RepID=UPI0026F01001|nr:thermonuclease family protein [Conchiformibius steedae]
MNTLIEWAWWLFEQVKATVIILINQDWSAFKVRHFAALLALYLLWRFILRPVVARLRLMRKFKGHTSRKRWCFGRVVNVVDGDTLDVRLGWFGKERVRMQYIDAPESQQDYGTQATRFVKRHAKGRTVLLVCAPNKDRYGRMLAEVFCPHLRRSLNLTMVEHGLAWAYNGTKIYTVAEQAARRKKTGLWRGRKPTNPAQFRRKGK